ncbi:uroporphyrinogen III methyltransferase/synthase [Geomicrobium halophilum]|uniref:Uroporphyrinogen-III C-methyltransferase n=1 Tax=Geomicrobium halophilum TaxID=549000 RepID=A0A841PQL0_9BACL|nr:uroporphyrinogen-III C-methyltransferase [Geomicrobium halophilum]MBB6450104.1 uroporphyrinogen III methyltransferase/synthase [Geomicrobium halophilum]
MVEQGTVYLVGAGPGDKELLTVKGLRVLQVADVVIYDRLVNPYLLTELKEDVKLIYCGKEPCKHILRQEDIQTEMLIHAKKGKTVVRLKGGDPAVFGRVGEEAAMLKANGVHFEIVPGVTSGIAASMYAGVPITHRDYSGSFAVVTGHRRKDDGKPDVNWKSLAESVDSILFYMGVKQIRTITSELVRYGKDKNTPVLVIQWGTYSRQRSIEGTLSTISKKMDNQKMANPAMILVGDVIKIRDQVNWFENHPLSGMGILIRTDDENDWLKRNGADVYIQKNKAMTVTDREIDLALGAGGDQALIFQETKDIWLFLQKMGERGHDIRKLAGALVAGNKDVQREFLLLGIQVPLFSEGIWLTPLFIAGAQDKQPTAEKVAMTRLIEEGHVNAAICRNKRDVDSICETSLHLFTANKDVESYARSLGFESVKVVDFNKSETEIVEQMSGLRNKGAVLS